LISVRRAKPADAPGIGGVHVSSWRSAYAGVLPDDFLANLSVARQTAYYDRAIRIGLGVHVAVQADPEWPGGARVVGFSTARRIRGVAEGEVETLYVLDDWKEYGLGRQLLRASGQHLAAMGCKSAFAWVLRDDPRRRLGTPPNCLRLGPNRPPDQRDRLTSSFAAQGRQFTACPHRAAMLQATHAQ
jgi:GNAT superfamily N-acetyltransferase